MNDTWEPSILFATSCESVSKYNCKKKKTEIGEDDFFRVTRSNRIEATCMDNSES
jgi:hypothetical protein